MRESELKREFRKLYDGWSSAVEPGFGCDPGIADVLIGVGRYGIIVPVELKWHEIDWSEANGSRLYPTKVRADQVQWHRKLRMHSWASLLITCDKTFESFYVIDSLLMEDWGLGYDIGLEAWQIFPTEIGMKREIEIFLKRKETPIGEE